jgi:Chaperone of endosialidase
MSEADGAAGNGAGQTGEGIDHERREALTRLAKYTAPAMLAMLLSVAESRALIVGSGGPPVMESDIRLKRDIARVGELDSGINLYRYRYLWSDTTYVGVMAQEVAEVVPEAILRGADGYLRVDYARLGLRLQTWDQWTAAH